MDGASADRLLEQYLRHLHETATSSIPPVEAGRPLRMYLRSCDAVFRQALIYRSEGDAERAFVLLLKYAELATRVLPAHPEWKQMQASGGGEHAALRKRVLQAVDILEATKPVVLDAQRERIAGEYARQQAEAAERARVARARAEDLARAAEQSQEDARRARIAAMRAMDERPVSSAPEPRAIAPEETPSAPAVEAVPLAMDLPSAPPAYDTAPTAPLVSTPPAIAPIPVPAEPAARLESGMPLRMVRVPERIVDMFLHLASPNTQRNLEFCGVLAGRLAHDVLTLTTLIIPRQTATSDTVAMEGEEELWLAQDSRDLLTLGWIHTHPTQACFMSSVDVHTHLSFQLQLAEAVAIVVAPTQRPNYGVFRLTDPPGLGVIAQCPKRGFHTHALAPGDDRAMYIEVSPGRSRVPGHVSVDAGLPLEVVDLRTL